MLGLDACFLFHPVRDSVICRLSRSVYMVVLAFRDRKAQVRHRGEASKKVALSLSFFLSLLFRFFGFCDAMQKYYHFSLNINRCHSV